MTTRYLTICISAGSLVEAQELEAVEPADGGRPHGPRRVRLVSRPVGENTVGVVAWQLTLKSPECPQGRQVRDVLCQNKDASI